MSYANLELYFPEINFITSCWENHKGSSKKSMKFKGGRVCQKFRIKTWKIFREIKVVVVKIH